MSVKPATIAVVYLARGEGNNVFASFRRFLSSYRAQPAGRLHDLFVIYKGFNTSSEVDRARAIFADVAHAEIFADDLTFDIGAYAAALRRITYDKVCFLNTYSELVSVNWLLKLDRNLGIPGVGLVGASGSYEAHRNLDPRIPPFPNIHVRTNAFMLRGELAREIFSTFRISSKLDAYLAESGETGITRQIESRGLKYLMIGSDGRGYAPEWWPTNGIFRQGHQRNLMIHDNETRRFAALPWGEKRLAYQDAWGQ